jgi:hypothetical protein
LQPAAERKERLQDLVEYHYGFDRPDSRKVLSATVRPDDTIELTHDYSDVGWGVRRLVFAKDADARVRAVANSKIDGTHHTIKGGRFVGDGREARWQSKCGNVS